MDLYIPIRLIYNVKNRYYAIRLTFGDKFLISTTKLVLEAKASICSAIKEDLLLHCLKFPAFVVAVII